MQKMVETIGYIGSTIIEKLANPVNITKSSSTAGSNEKREIHARVKICRIIWLTF